MCDKIVAIFPFVFDSVSDQYKIQEMCDQVFVEDLSMLKYCLHRYKAQEICDEAADRVWMGMKLDKINFDEDNPKAVILVNFSAWKNRLKHREALKKK